MNSKIQELRNLIRKEIKSVIDESNTEKIKAQISNTETDIEKKSKAETDRLAALYTQLGAELKKGKP